MVLNVTDEVIVGDPKYTITSNGDGTSSIALANTITTQGTSLNKALFDKVENVLSYQVPTVNSTISQTETITGKTAHIDKGTVQTNGNVKFTISNTFQNITPELEWSNSNNGEFSFSSSSNTIMVESSNVSTFAGLETAMNQDTKITYYNYTGTQNLFNFIYDFKTQVNATLNYYYLQLNSVTARCYGSNDKTNWTVIANLTQTTSSVNITISNYRYIKIVFTMTQNNSNFTVYGIYVRNIAGSVDVYSSNFELPTLTSVLNNQIVKINSIFNVANINNTLNNIDIDTLLKNGAYYELVYNSTQNKFIAQEVRT